jgi:predicted enzyme related to lactoylglutathione lyase
MFYSEHVAKEDDMAARIGNITFDCADPDRLATFWAATLGYEKESLVALAALFEAQPELVNTFAAARDPHQIGPRLFFQKVPEPKTVKNRVHLDINAADREAEVARLVGLGATVLDTRSHSFTGPDGREHAETWTVLVDPEGNEFCVQ